MELPRPLLAAASVSDIEESAKGRSMPNSEMGIIMKRTAVSLAAAALLTGGFVVAEATAASAHHLPRCTTYRDMDPTSLIKNQPTTLAGSPMCELHRGDNNPAVRTLQQALRQCEAHVVPTTGAYEYYTERAVQHEQAAAGQAITGFYDPALRSALRWVVTNPYTRTTTCAY